MSTFSTSSKGPIAWMAGNSVAANLIMIVCLIGGLIVGSHIKQEVFPDFDLDMVSVTVAYPGASPEEVEKGIILPIEEAVQGLDGVDDVTSSASEGSGSVIVEIVEGENIQRLAQDIQSEVDRITSFPDDAEEPSVTIVSRKREVVSLALHGAQSDWVLRETAEDLRDRLIQDPNITQVELHGVRDYEISVEVPQENLRRYNLTIAEVAARIDKASVDLPGGGIKTSGGEILVRVKERKDYGREFGKIPIITGNDGTSVLLEDIAEINDGFEDSDIFASFDGQPAVLIDVYRIGDQTPIDVADAVKRNVETFRQILPQGLSLNILKDRSNVYKQRLELLLTNGYMGLGLVFLCLALFLEARLAFWVSMGIPISFLGSLLLLPGFGVTINMISLFAFIITLGIVVDDAIVVGENVYNYHQKGMSFLDAAIQGAREIAMPVTFSVLTNVVTFMPMYFVPGVMGKVFRQIPLVVVSVFAVSLVESLLVLPAHLGHQRDRRRSGITGWMHGMQQRFSKWFIHVVKTKYGPFLDLTLKYRYLTMSVGVAILLVTVGYVQSGRMGLTLFPKIEADYAKVTAVLPYGTAVEKTKEIQKILVDAGREVGEENGGDQLVTGIFARIMDGGSTSEVRVYLTDPEVRPVSTADFTRMWRERVGDLVGLEYITYESDSGGPGSGKSLTVELSHRDINVLEKASAELARELEVYPNVKDIDDGFSPGKRQYDFKIRDSARGLGLRAEDVARQVRYAFYGAEALRQQRGRNEVKVMVRLPKSERVLEHNIEELILRTPSGVEIPLREAVTMTPGRAYTTIDRHNGRRTVEVTANVIPQSKANEILNALMAESLPWLVEKYPGLSYGFEGKQADMRESMSSLVEGLLLALLVIYGLLAVPFRSYAQPLIIMVSIPFGIVGAVLGHLLMGYSLSLMSLFGIVALSGVVVNDSLVLINFANRKRQENGMNAHDAVLSAGVARFRPIILTTLTTFGGLAPMIFETSRQARFLIPMAISLGFGIVFATLITLVLVPSLYMVIVDAIEILRCRGK
ncbi:efflux RND transporter permease subunit [Desulfoplanes formicivorans]|uniref:Cobalt-zinc-cadmium resistance protein n=1 Tax=Desulfoplanes formicivorans TaxID=1592317 RepID=A0A194AFX4_9BACT|nr:efflux RND transporter permease subunit [Desulfoplanes formicivorans]GAU07669.1 cobalt-zinc-cadmium resistance protein [Desulfoplanes formicivorans]